MTFDISHNLDPVPAGAATPVNHRPENRSDGPMNYTPNHLKKLHKTSEKLRLAEHCPASFAAFLRNQHPHDTAYWVASMTGVSEGTVEAWLYERAMPQVRHLGPLMAIYGPPVLAAIYPKATAFKWLGEALRCDEAEQIDAEIERLQSRKRRIEGDNECEGHSEMR